MTNQEPIADGGASSGAAGSTTLALVRHLLELNRAPVEPRAAMVAKQCLLDWLGVTLAARREPLVCILLDEFAVRDDDRTGCTIVGQRRTAPLYDAVLINGATGHALDFDDVLAVMGHPTVPVAPVVIALGESLGSTGASVLAAFVTGVEAEARVGALLGPSHYEQGWHSTATLGAFGAAAAAGALLGLDETRMRNAFGLAGTQAAGLKSVFGTMSKPLHAGKAAQSGLLAARLAALGFTSDTDILDSAQGFAATQSTELDRAGALRSREAPHVIDALFKYHAACYLTHNTIEAAVALRNEEGLTPNAIESITVQVQPMHLGVCNIETPGTGLECKFSLRMTCALALAGEDTFDERLFSDATAQRPDLVALCGRTCVEGTSPDLPSRVTVACKDGRTLSRAANVAVPMRDLEAQQRRLERKFRHLVRDILHEAAAEQVIEICQTLERQPDVRGLLKACSEGLRL